MTPDQELAARIGTGSMESGRNAIPGCSFCAHGRRADAFDTAFAICETQICCLFGGVCRMLVVPKWRNWQTRVVQVHVLARVWGFESLLRHQKSRTVF
jgi:hypothetical protein